MAKNYAYYEGLTNTNNILSDLKDKITLAYADASATNNWTVLLEKKDSQMRTSELHLKGKTDKNKDMFISIVNPFDKKMIQIKSSETMLKSGEAGSETVTATNPTENTSFHFVKPSSSAPRDESTPINYYLSITNNKIALVLQGDPTIDFTGYVKNFMYFGAIISMDDTDINNICLTVGSELTPSVPSTYGQYTSDCVTTMALLATKSGVKWQKHYPSFITQDETIALEPTGFNASRWTGKYHLSPIYVVHPYDGYRGQLEGVIAVNKNNILHLDELLVETETDTIKDRYKYFDQSPTNSMFKNSPHKKEGVALLKSPGETHTA